LPSKHPFVGLRAHASRGDRHGDIISISCETTVAAVVRLMFDNPVSGLPVIDVGTLVGGLAEGQYRYPPYKR
jgi:predicted transcriptional regulator